jgi:hypothetical protein
VAVQVVERWIMERLRPQRSRGRLNHDRRAHVGSPPRPSRMDTAAADSLGAADRRGNRLAGHTAAAGTTPPGTRYRACLGLLSLSRRYGRERLKAACALALELGVHRYRHVRDIPVNNRDRASATTHADWISPSHAHVRGTRTRSRVWLSATGSKPATACSSPAQLAQGNRGPLAPWRSTPADAHTRRCTCACRD